MLTAQELLDVVVPKHDRVSCSDTDISNGFGTRLGAPHGHGRCTRCMWLQLIDGTPLPRDLDPAESIHNVLG